MAVTVLFISSLNSARSQIAEGLLRELGGDSVDVASAGSAGLGLDPRALLVMAERGIDISRQRSKGVEEYIGSARFDYLITLCERDEKACPVFPGMAEREYWPFEDPARAAAEAGDGLAPFREVRDRLEARIAGWLDAHHRKLAQLASKPERQPASAGRQAA